MIKFLSPCVPAKVKRSVKKITKNKILWIADSNISMAIFEVRLNQILKYWKYEKTIYKSDIDYLDYIRCRQNFKTLYIYD